MATPACNEKPATSPGGKTIGKKDVAQQAIAYGNVYVARIAQRAAHLRWNVYEKMASRSVADFPADGRRE